MIYQYRSATNGCVRRLTTWRLISNANDYWQLERYSYVGNPHWRHDLIDTKIYYEDTKTGEFIQSYPAYQEVNQKESLKIKLTAVDSE